MLKGILALKVKRELLAHKVEPEHKVEKVLLAQLALKVLLDHKVLKALKVLLAHKVEKVKKELLAQQVLTA